MPAKKATKAKKTAKKGEPLATYRAKRDCGVTP